jgi:hypothetical protein
MIQGIWYSFYKVYLVSVSINIPYPKIPVMHINDKIFCDYISVISSYLFYNQLVQDERAIFVVYTQASRYFSDDISRYPAAQDISDDIERQPFFFCKFPYLNGNKASF